MATQPKHPITVEQYFEFEGVPGFRDELIHGRIVMTPQPKPLHQLVASNIERLLSDLCKGSRFATIRDSNTSFPHLDSSPAPDVFVVTVASLRRAVTRNEYIDEPPLAAVEVLSPGQNVDVKIHLYLLGGVPQVWVVTPESKTVEIFTSASKQFYEKDEQIPFLKGKVMVSDLFKGIPE